MVHSHTRWDDVGLDGMGSVFQWRRSLTELPAQPIAFPSYPSACMNTPAH